jgi:hypothetical protein
MFRSNVQLVNLVIVFLPSDNVPRWFLLQTTITRHHCRHFPTLSQEQLSLSLKSNLALYSLLSLS